MLTNQAKRQINTSIGHAAGETKSKPPSSLLHLLHLLPADRQVGVPANKRPMIHHVAQRSGRNFC